MSEEIRIIDVKKRVAWLRDQADKLLELAKAADEGAHVDLSRLPEIQRIDYAEELRRGAANNLRAAAELEMGIGVE